MTIFGIDAASYQGNVNWASVDKVCDFGFEKVTEGVGYTNPYWPTARTAMKARAAASRFLPGAYLFMDFGEGAAQADHFADKAGSLEGFALVVDLERAPNGSPTIAQARACVARLRQRYPHHPIGGYAPHWYTGTADLRFFDYLWASHYVSGTGSPAGLYSKVPSSWWAAYGGLTPALLQFSSSATVAGVSGRVDISAFKGSLDQLRALALGAKEDGMPEPKDLFEWDGIPAPPWIAEQGNKYWTASSYLHWLYRNLAKVSAKLDAQAATIDKLVDAVGQAGSFDPAELKAEIRAAIESIEIKLGVPDAQAEPPADA